MKTKVMIVDDSHFMRAATAKLLESSPQIEVVSMVSSGEEAVRQLPVVQPDVVTLDYNLPGMNGIETLGRIMKRRPTPVVMFSGHTKIGAEVTLRALQMGALDFVQKPHGSLSLDISTVTTELISKVLAAATSRVMVKMPALADAADAAVMVPDKLLHPEKSILFIASSTGGVGALAKLIPHLPADFPMPVLIVQHMPPLFTRSLAASLDKKSKLRVKEAEEGETIYAGVVYVAPGGWQTKVVRRDAALSIVLDKTDSGSRLKPCADITMKSIASHYGRNSMAVILTGMGSDGTAGAGVMKEAGAVILAQDEATSSIYGMPKSVFDAGYADAVLPLPQMARQILSLAGVAAEGHKPFDSAPEITVS